MTAAALPDHAAERLDRFHIETPSWGFADSGTRFGIFKQPAAAKTLEHKLQDAAHVHRLTGCCPTVALHVLWDFDLEQGLEAAAAQTCSLAEQAGIGIGAINPNVFQDHAYRFGSLSSPLEDARRMAAEHLAESAKLAGLTGSSLVSLWFADGTNYPGQGSFVERKHRMQQGLRDLHAALPEGVGMLVEYKPFEPSFYHTDIADWGMAAAFARHAGPHAKVLVDTGHHLPATNIEHIVAFLIDEGLLGGFHFNDSKYADDDLTMGSIDPHQLFRIFVEIVSAEHRAGRDLDIAYMIDQSHNLKPKIEAMLQTADMAQTAMLKALLVDQEQLAEARSTGDPLDAEEVLRDAFETDVRPMLAGWRRDRNLPEHPVAAHRKSGYEAEAAEQRG